MLETHEEREQETEKNKSREVNPERHHKETEMVLGIERKNDLDREDIIQRN